MARIGIALPREDDKPREEMLAWVQSADAHGYESVWVPEAWGRDAFTLATQVAMLTKQIKIATGIVTVYSRTPAMLAQTAASLDEISNGRVILGLGTSGPIVIENWHGVKFDRPIQRTREYIEIIRLALSGERVNYSGEIFHLRNFRLPFRPVQKRIPIYIGSLGPRNLELTGELADGWLPVFISPQHMGVFTEHLEAGAKSAGRNVAEIDVAAYIFALVTDDVGAAKSLVRQHIAYYVGGMGTFYNNLVRRYGFEEEAAAVKEAWAKGDRKTATAHVSDAMVNAVAIVGTVEESRHKLAEYRAAGITHPVLAFPHGATGEMIHQTIDALAP